MTSTLFQPRELFERDESVTRPKLWIRRLQIRRGLSLSSEIVREVSFRRGLNVVCTAEPTPGEARIVGHSVGKTMLTRLIRYSLGEPRFGRPEVEAAVAAALPGAWVLAEVEVEGAAWAVARPLSFETRQSEGSLAREASALEELLNEQEPSRSFRRYLDALEALCPGNRVEHGPSDGIRWRQLLAWLARDQECRFRDQITWRDPASGSDVGQPPREEAHRLVRHAVGLLGERERLLEDAHRQLLEEKQRIDQRLSRLDAGIAFEREALQPIAENHSLRLPDVAGLTLEPFLQKCSEITEQLVRLRDEPTDALESIVELVNERQALAVQVGQHVGEAGLFREFKQARDDQLAKAQAKLSEKPGSELASAGINACDVFDTVEEAEDRGCRYHPESAQYHADQRRAVREEASELHQAVAEFERRIAAAEEAAAKGQRDLVRVGGELQDLRERQQNQLVEINERIGQWRNTAERAHAFTGHLRRQDELVRESSALMAKVDGSNRSKAAAREEVHAARRRLSVALSGVLTILTGRIATTEIKIHGDQLRWDPPRGLGYAGQAVQTVTGVVGFDLACLAGAIAGDGSLPRFLIHDSPREADMEEALYWRLFEVAEKLEALFPVGEAGFQYIVTTTTPPPARLDREPFVRLRLDARDEETHLLKQRLQPVEENADDSRSA